MYSKVKLNSLSLTHALDPANSSVTNLAVTLELAPSKVDKLTKSSAVFFRCYQVNS